LLPSKFGWNVLYGGWWVWSFERWSVFCKHQLDHGVEKWLHTKLSESDVFISLGVEKSTHSALSYKTKYLTELYGKFSHWIKKPYWIPTSMILVRWLLWHVWRKSWKLTTEGESTCNALGNRWVLAITNKRQLNILGCYISYYVMSSKLHEVQQV
jgi:hypothetical protein